MNHDDIIIKNSKSLFLNTHLNQFSYIDPSIVEELKNITINFRLAF